MTTKSGCKIVIHDIKCTIDLHLTWVIFQIMDVAKTSLTIFQEGSCFKSFMLQKVTSFNSSPLFVHFMFLTFPYIITIVIKMGMLLSSHQSWLLGKVIH